ncbi:MAG: YihY/virulence factor BrkB family protein [Planctomycetota bacterium]
MGVISNIKDKGNALLAREASELNRLQKTVRFSIRLTLYCARQLSVCRAGQMAAALTYHTLFSLLPTIALMLVVARVFMTDTRLDEITDGTVDYIIRSFDPEAANDSDAPITVDQETPTSVDGALPGAAIDGVTLADPGEPIDVALPADAAGGEEVGRQEEFEQTREALRTQIESWISQLKSISFGSIGVVGVAFFIYGATALLATIERSFNRIYGTDAARPIQLRIPMYFTVIVLAPLVLAMGQVVSQSLKPYLMLDTLTETAEQIGFIGWFFTWLGSTFSPLITTWFVLLAMYVLLPTAKVSLRCAAIGATVAAIGWTLLVELFGLYVGGFTGEGSANSKLYGALALLPLFLLWLYLTWIIVLFGFILTRTLQNLKGWEIERQRQATIADQLVSPDAVVPAMALVAQRFDRGKTIDRDGLAHELVLPVPAATRLIDALVKGGLLHRLADADGAIDDAPLSLSRPPHRVPLTEVLAVGDRLARGGRTQDAPVAETVLDRLAQARRDAVAGETLADAAGLADGKPAADTAAVPAPPAVAPGST